MVNRGLFRLDGHPLPAEVLQFQGAQIVQRRLLCYKQRIRGEELPVQVWVCPLLDQGFAHIVIAVHDCIHRRLNKGSVTPSKKWQGVSTKVERERRVARPKIRYICTVTH